MRIWASQQDCTFRAALETSFYRQGRLVRGQVDMLPRLHGPVALRCHLDYPPGHLHVMRTRGAFTALARELKSEPGPFPDKLGLPQHFHNLQPCKNLPRPTLC